MKRLVSLVLSLCIIIAIAGCAAKPTEEQIAKFEEWHTYVTKGNNASHPAIAVAKVLADYSSGILEIPSSIFDEYDGFTYTDEIGKSWETTILAEDAPVTVSASVLGDAIDSVSYKISKDSFDHNDANSAAAIIKFLIDAYGEPNEITLDDSPSTVESIEEKFYSDNPISHTTIKWTVGNGEDQYNVLYQKIINGDPDIGVVVAMDGLMVF